MHPRATLLVCITANTSRWLYTQIVQDLRAFWDIYVVQGLHAVWVDFCPCVWLETFKTIMHMVQGKYVVQSMRVVQDMPVVQGMFVVQDMRVVQNIRVTWFKTYMWFKTWTWSKTCMLFKKTCLRFKACMWFKVCLWFMACVWFESYVCCGSRHRSGSKNACACGSSDIIIRFKICAWFKKSVWFKACLWFKWCIRFTTCRHCGWVCPPLISGARWPNTGEARTAIQTKLGVPRKQAAVSKEMRIWLGSNV